MIFHSISSWTDNRQLALGMISTNVIKKSDRNIWKLLSANDMKISASSPYFLSEVSWIQLMALSGIWKRKAFRLLS
jgi:hypothetical protein